VSRSAQHRKPQSLSIRSSGAHRREARARRGFSRRTWLTIGAICSVLVGTGIAQAATGGSWLPGQSAALNHAAGSPHRGISRSPGVTQPGPASSSSHRRRSASPSQSASPSKRRSLTATPAPTATADGYADPLRAVSNLVPQRIDQGVDFAGAGPVYALGDAVITNAQGDSAGWPGGGWITYRMTSGPASGLSVFLAEDVRPTVQVGDRVTSSTVIANMSDNGDGIEFGWAQVSGVSTESQLPQAGGISGGGPFPTKVGLNFDDLLIALGAPVAYNHGDPPHGFLPAGYPGSWSGLRG
jgi:hypothetical protein